MGVIMYRISEKKKDYLKGGVTKRGRKTERSFIQGFTHQIAAMTRAMPG